MYRMLYFQVSQYSFANDTCQLAYETYLRVETGKGKVRPQTLSIIAEASKIPLELFYFATDEEGRLTTTESIEPIFRLFLSANLRGIIHNDDYLHELFIDEIADSIVVQYNS